MIENLLAWLNQPDVITVIVASGSMGLFFVGLFGLLTQRHLIKIFISIAVMETAVFLFFRHNLPERFDCTDIG